jgi:Domain of unknown function (DUF6438)
MRANRVVSLINEQEVPVLHWPLLAFGLAAQEPSRAAAAPVQITLKRTACFGECPDYTVTIEGDGSVTYEGRRFVRVTGRQTGRISRSAVDALLEEFRRIDFFSLKDEYTAHVTDLPTTYVALRQGERQKEIKDYIGAPKSLRDLEHHIDEAAGVERWVRIDAATVKELARSGWRAGAEDGQEMLRKALECDETDVVEALIDAGADVNGGSGLPPLMSARSVAAAKLLISAGANVHARAGGGATPLTVSIYKDPGMTRALLDAGAAPEDAVYEAPLSLAACIGNAVAVEMLLKAGAAPDRRDSRGMTPRECAESARLRPEPPELFSDLTPPFLTDFDRVIALLEQAMASKKK